VLVFVVLGVILFTSMYGNVKPEKLDISLLTVADKTIRSPATVEDKISTEKKTSRGIGSSSGRLYSEKGIFHESSRFNHIDF
jgi:membrane-associated HD superfamily phosphohydrolase